MPLAHGDVKEISRKDSKSIFIALVIAIHILSITVYVLMYTLRSPFVSKRKILYKQQSQTLKQSWNMIRNLEVTTGLQHY